MHTYTDGSTPGLFSCVQQQCWSWNAFNPEGTFECEAEPVDSRTREVEGVPPPARIGDLEITLFVPTKGLLGPLSGRVRSGTKNVNRQLVAPLCK